MTMKKLFLLGALIWLANCAVAQTGTDLQFSRTYLFCQDQSDPLTTVGTVPAGKIWKVVGATPVTASSWGFVRLYVDGDQVDLVYKSSSGDNVRFAQFPLYINENAVVELDIHGSDGCVSLIEYTVLP